MIWFTSLYQWMDEELKTMKRVCFKAALASETFMTPSIAFWSPPSSIGWMGSQRQ